MKIVEVFALPNKKVFRNNLKFRICKKRKTGKTNEIWASKCRFESTNTNFACENHKFTALLIFQEQRIPREYYFLKDEMRWFKQVVGLRADKFREKWI